MDALRGASLPLLRGHVRMRRELAEACYSACIAVLHGDVGAPPPPPGASSHAAEREYSVLDQLVATILSQNTTDSNSWPAFLKLKAAFPSWDAVRTADVALVAAAIRSAGLSAIKSARIQAILEALHAQRGACCLEYMHAMEDEVAKAELARFKGVGPKTIACVLMFALRRQEFPVDTHVVRVASVRACVRACTRVADACTQWKLARVLGWVPAAADREATYAHLNARVPGALKHELHVLLVHHGKAFKNEAGPLRAALGAALSAAPDGGDEL